VGYVVHLARDEVVDGDDVMALGEETVGKMRAEKTSAAGDDGHGNG
jgi:hypothetical protein